MKNKLIRFHYFKPKIEFHFVVCKTITYIHTTNISKDHICKVLKEKDAKTIVDILNENAELGVY